MLKRILFGGLFTACFAAHGAQTTYDITGSLVSQENTCTQVTITFAPLRDCSYGDTRALQTGIGFQMPSDWLGPVGGSVYYEPTAPQADPAVLPAPGDMRIAVPITGTFTIDDMDDPDPTMHVISATFDIGEMIRSVTTGQTDRAVEGWTTMTHTMAPTLVSATSAANGNGGFDYIIAQGGILPPLICPMGVAPDFTSGDCFPTDADLPATPPLTPWWETPTPSPGVGIARGAAFAPGQDETMQGPPFPAGPAFGAALTTATFTGYNCVDTGAGDCPTNMATIGQGEPGNGSSLLWGAEEDAGFDNFILSLKTDGSGNITEANVYWTQETFIGFSPFMNPQDMQPDNSWSAGRIAFTGQAQVSFEAVDDPNETAAEGVPAVLDVLANDVGVADGVMVMLADAPDDGTVDIVGSGGPLAGITVTYTSASPLTIGPVDTFDYTIEDGVNPPSTATVTVTRQGSGANPDAVSTRLNAAINIDALANDSGFVDPVTVSITVNPDMNGTVAINGTSPGPQAAITFDYTPVAPLGTATYTETFTYQIEDAAMMPQTAVVTVTVNNEVPAGAAGTATTAEDTAVTTDIAAIAGVNLGDAPSVITVTTAPMNGMTSVNGTSVTYTPATLFDGMDSYGYTITDDDGETATGTVSVTVTGLVPTANDDMGETEQGEAVTIDVVANDVPGSGAVADHVVTVTGAPAGGSTSVTGVNVTYTPDASFSGMDQFTYTLTDANGDEDTAVVSITVNAAEVVAKLPGTSSALDPWSLSLMLLGVPMLRRRIDRA